MRTTTAVLATAAVLALATPVAVTAAPATTSAASSPASRDGGGTTGAGTTGGGPAPRARACERSLRATLQTHLDAITERDLAALAPTVHDDMVLIFPSGSMRVGKEAFMDFHRDWFADPLWAEPYEIADVNVFGCQSAWTLIDYRYQELNEAGEVIDSSHAYFSLTWTRERGRWLAVADQNTPLPD